MPKRYEEDFLDRLDIDVADYEDELEFEKAMLKNWEHAYNPTSKQVSALFPVMRERAARAHAPPAKSKGKLWTKTPKGRLIPRLASAGIRRKTFTQRGRNITRYFVPGRAGLFGLTRAREIFGQI